MKIGVQLRSLALPLRRALFEAQRLGVTGVELDAVGELSPNQLSQTGRRELRNLLRAHSLELTALGCPLRHGLDVVEGQEARIDHLRNVLSLSFDLGPRIVIVEAGRLPEKADDPRAGPITEALLALGHHGDRVGARLALETGLDSGEAICRFLAPLDTGGLGVNFDPANLLINGIDPYESVGVLAARILHAHAKDARVAGASRAVREVPLGHGDLEWMRLLADLAEVEYRGWLVVEQQVGDNRRADVAAGVAFLRRLLP